MGEWRRGWEHRGNERQISADERGNAVGEENAEKKWRGHEKMGDGENVGLFGPFERRRIRHNKLEEKEMRWD